MRLQKCLAILFIISLLTASCGAKQPNEQPPVDEGKEYLPDWQEGYLDIHQISTGRGNSAFLIMPDGTTMIIDAGDIGATSNIGREVMPAVPNVTKRPAEWIALYAQNFSNQVATSGKIDYMLLTHMHTDHIGNAGSMAISAPGKDYKLTGVTHLAELLEFETLVDRDYPNYNYPATSFFADETSANYLKYVQARKASGGKVDKFSVGSNNQFKLLNSPEKYPGFEIRNIYANGKIWAGTGTATEDIFPAASVVAAANNENLFSAVIKLTYGKFTYHSGGDILGQPDTNAPWWDIERKVAGKIGEMDVVLANHHAFDTMFEPFLSATRPQAIIIPIWDYYHPEPAPAKRLFDKSFYPDDRLIFAAGMVPSNRARLGAEGALIKPDGHVVVRVYPNGNEFQIFVLNDRSTEYEIIYKTDLMKSRD